jgi:hypothetical protein
MRSGYLCHALKKLVSSQDFFIEAPQELLQAVWVSGQELQQHLPTQQGEAIDVAVTSLRTRWDDVLGRAPLHLLQVGPGVPIPS